VVVPTYAVAEVVERIGHLTGLRVGGKPTPVLISPSWTEPTARSRGSQNEVSVSVSTIDGKAKPSVSSDSPSTRIITETFTCSLCKKSLKKIPGESTRPRGVERSRSVAAVWGCVQDLQSKIKARGIKQGTLRERRDGGVYGFKEN